MPVGGARAVPDELIRRVRVVRGKLPFRLECRPAFDYARAGHQLQLSDHGARFDGPKLSLGLAAPMPLQPDGHGVVADFTLGEGESATFVLRLLRPEDLPKPCPGVGEAEELFRDTVDILAALAGEVHLHRPLAGDGPSICHDAQAAVVRADGCDRCGADL